MGTLRGVFMNIACLKVLVLCFGVVSYSEVFAAKKDPLEENWSKKDVNENPVYNDPTTKVNVNEQTNLFEEKTGGWSEMQNEIARDKSRAQEGLKSNANLDFITNKKKEEIELAKEASGI